MDREDHRHYSCSTSQLRLWSAHVEFLPSVSSERKAEFGRRLQALCEEFGAKREEAA